MADEEEDLDVVEDFLPEGASTIVGLKRQVNIPDWSRIERFRRYVHRR